MENLRIGTAPDYRPFCSKDNSGRLTGFDFDIGVALAKEMKVRAIWVEVDFDGLIPALRSKKIDAIISCFSITDHRKCLLDFAASYCKTPARLLTLKTYEGDLAGKNVGVVEGTTHQHDIRHLGLRQTPYQNQDLTFLDLDMGRLEAIVADEAMLQHNMHTQYAFKGPAIDDSATEIGVGVRKGETKTVERLEAAMAAIRSNGVYRQIYSKHFSEDTYAI